MRKIVDTIIYLIDSTIVVIIILQLMPLKFIKQF